MATVPSSKLSRFGDSHGSAELLSRFGDSHGSVELLSRFGDSHGSVDTAPRTMLKRPNKQLPKPSSTQN